MIPLTKSLPFDSALEALLQQQLINQYVRISLAVFLPLLVGLLLLVFRLLYLNWDQGCWVGWLLVLGVVLAGNLYVLLQQARIRRPVGIRIMGAGLAVDPLGIRKLAGYRLERLECLPARGSKLPAGAKRPYRAIFTSQGKRIHLKVYLKATSIYPHQVPVSPLYP